MSIQREVMFRISCDWCSTEVLGPEDEPVVWSLEDLDEAGRGALEQGWTTDGHRHHCPGCSELHPLANPEPPQAHVPLLDGQAPLFSAEPAEPPGGCS